VGAKPVPPPLAATPPVRDWRPSLRPRVADMLAGRLPLSGTCMKQPSFFLWAVSELGARVFTKVVGDRLWAALNSTVPTRLSYLVLGLYPLDLATPL
jgi:hypothetical protein